MCAGVCVSSVGMNQSRKREREREKEKEKERGGDGGREIGWVCLLGRSNKRRQGIVGHFLKAKAPWYRV